MAVPLDQSPVLWLDADDTGTVTISTGVATWADKSGLGNDFTQPFGGALEPAYVTNAINSRHAIRFAGTKFLYRADDSDLYLTGDFSVFFVLTFSSVAKGPTAQNTIMSRNSDKWEFFEYQGNTTGYVNGSGINVGSGELAATVPYILEYHRDGSNSVTASLNGVADSTTTISGDNTASQEVIIGARPSGSSDLYLQGDIGEILLFSSKLGTSDRDAVYAYLADRWGLKYTTEVLADSALAFLKLSETSGTAAVDSSLYARTGPTYTNFSSIGTQPGVVGTMATTLFDNSNDLIEGWSGGSGFASITTPCVEAIVKPSSIGGGVQGIAHDSDGSSWNWYLRLNAGVVEFGWNSGGEKKVTGPTLTAGVEYHIIAGTDGAGNGTITVNNVDYTGSPGGTPGTTARSLRVGAGFSATSTNWPFNGVISHVAIYGSLLSGTRRTDHYNAYVGVTVSLLDDTDSFALSESESPLLFRTEKVATDRFLATDLDFLNYTVNSSRDISFAGHRTYATFLPTGAAASDLTPTRTLAITSATTTFDIFLLDPAQDTTTPTGTLTLDIGTPGDSVRSVTLTGPTSGRYVATFTALPPGVYQARVTVNASGALRSYPTEAVTITVA